MGEPKMRGFVFTIDALMALLFAFFIISVQGTTVIPYEAKITLDSIASVHQNTGNDLESLMERAGVCGKYKIYDVNMEIVKEGASSCTCKEYNINYDYVYVEMDDVYIVRMEVCSGYI
ncbi:MAG: hypothetical protein ACP5H8_01640 [Candidatus Micrarchaeia archaeon]